METISRSISNDQFTSFVNKRNKNRNMDENDWIETHASGTLRKNKRIGFAYRSQYLAERIAYEFGYGFEIVPKTRVTFNDPISEGDCHAITEAGWHIERYMVNNIFGDYVEAKYIHITYEDSKKEGVGIIVRETSCEWIPKGHLVLAIVSEFNPIRNRWENAINPF